MLLAVEDDSRFADVLKRLVEEQGFDCKVAGTGEQALAMARELMPSGILLDVGLPDQSGLAVLERLKRDSRTRHIPVHLVSSHGRSQAAMELGAIGHLVKPAQREQLVEAIRLLEQKLDQPLRRVLVVEDDAAMRSSLQELLAGPQTAITSVGTVAGALQALGTTTFDCMVTDLALPDGSGFDLLERMSASEQLGFPPVIVYTGRALSRDEEIRLRRHSRSIIVKGARSPERLLDEVTLFLHSVEAQLPSEQRRLLDVARSRDSVLEGRCVLLAEDDVRNIFALASVFEPQGVRLEIARNGREAVEKVTAPNNNIDLVLMDVMMPEMDGLEAMRRIRRAPGMAQLPIIALTAKAMADDRQQCLDAGANDYLAKPIDVERLLSLCRVWMPK
jgi:CheY-like chemotaxis protein